MIKKASLFLPDFTICFIFFNEKAYKQCDGVADIVFAVHSSGNLATSNYRKEKDFVKRLAATLNIAPGRSRIALILYSNFATAPVRLDEENTLASFDNLVDGLPHERGLTRIDRALKLARSIFDTNGSITRRGVPKILILLTDGKQTVAPDATSLDEAARPLHEADVKILTVGMGSNVDVKELRAMSLDNKDVFLAPSFDDLLSLSGSVAKIMCDAASKYKVKMKLGSCDFDILIKVALGVKPVKVKRATVLCRSLSLYYKRTLSTKESKNSLLGLYCL